MVDETFEVIGVVHLPRLPSAFHNPGYATDSIVDFAVRDAKVLEELGYSGVLVENYGDKPYAKRVHDPLTIAVMSIVVREVVKSTKLKVGINLLRNSGREAYSIAVAARASFIRVNGLVETIVSDSGIIEPEAPRLKVLLTNYPGVKVYSDILVKHAVSLRGVLGLLEAPTIVSKGLQEDYVRELVEEHVERGGASALVVTGLKTGGAPPLDLVKIVKKYSPVPVLVGSGITADNVCEYAKYCDGIIVGSFIKKNGKAGNEVDYNRALAFIRKARECSK